MDQEFQVTTDAPGGLDELFSALTDEADALEREGVSFRATTKKSPAFGAGMPEIADLIIALGAAGVFSALTTAFDIYFRRRPSGKITFRTDTDSVTLTAENCDATQVARLLKGLRPSGARQK